MPAWQVGVAYVAVVIRCMDGDTCDVTWAEDGKMWGLMQRIRIARLDAPEIYPRVESGGMAAKGALEKMVVGRYVLVVPRRAWPDQYGRCIADLVVDGQDVTTMMIKGGYGTLYNWRLRKAARMRTNGAQPTSAMPKRKLRTAPRRTNGQPVSRPSMSIGAAGLMEVLPSQEKVEPCLEEEL